MGRIININPRAEEDGQAKVEAYIRMLVEAIDGLQQLRDTDPEIIKQHSHALAEEASNLKSLSVHAATMLPVYSRADDALAMLDFAAEEVRAVFHRSPGAVADKLSELNAISHKLSGVVCILRIWRRLALQLRMGKPVQPPQTREGYGV